MDDSAPPRPRQDPELRKALKRALRDLGATAREAGIDLPQGREILAQLDAAEAELRERLGDADPSMFRNDERCIQLNRYRTQAYVAFGRLVQETFPLESLPAKLQPYALRVIVLDPIIDPVRGLIESPMQQQQEDGTYVLPGHVIQPKRNLLWYVLFAGLIVVGVMTAVILWLWA